MRHNLQNYGYPVLKKSGVCLKKGKQKIEAFQLYILISGINCLNVTENNSENNSEISQENYLRFDTWKK